MASDESDLYDSDSDPGVATRTHHGPKSVQFDLSSSPSQFPDGFPRRRPSSRSHHRHRSTERPPNPFAPASAPFPVPGSRARPMPPPHLQTQNLPPLAQFSRSMDGNPFSPNPVNQPPPPYYSYPSPAAGYNYPPGQHPNSAPPRPPSSGHHRSNPFDPSPRSYSDRDSPYYGIPVPSQPQPIPRYESRTPSRPKPRPIQPQSMPSSRVEQDLEHVQRTMSSLLEREKARERQALEAAQHERDMAILRREMDRKMKIGLGEIRNELFQTEEPGPPPRSEYGMRMYTTPARSVDERTYWAGRPGAPPPDLNQQEMDQLWEGKRQLDTQYANRIQGRQDPRLEFDRRSSFSSRLDPEQMQRAIAAGVEVALSELDSLSQRPSSTVYGTSPTARRQSAQMWPNGMYRAETMEPRSSPFAPPSPVVERRAFDRHAAAADNNPQTEADWVGRPRPRPRRRTEGREMNITVQRSSAAPGRSASHRDKPRSSRPEQLQMSGGRGGPTYHDVGAHTTAVVRRIPADQVGPRRLYPNGYREPYFEEDTDSDESNAQTLARYPPPPVPDPPR